MLCWGNSALRQLLLQLLQQQLHEKNDLRPLRAFANTMWAFGWRCVSRLNLTCTRFQSAEVQSFVRPPPLSFTHTILTFDPSNVIQMSCVMGATALTGEERPLYEDGGHRNNGFSQTGAARIKCLYWELFFLPLANSSSKFLCKNIMS